MPKTRTLPAPATLSGLLLAGLALAPLSTAFAADAQRQIDRTVAARPGLVVELHNLAGNVTVAPASGSEVRVAATVHAAAASSAEAERIAGLLSLAVEQVGERWVVKAIYPLDESRKYCYPRQAQEESIPWFLAWLDIGSSNFKYADREVRVVSQASGGALTLYADFRVEVPAGVGVRVKDGIGQIASAGVRGAQNLDIATGGIEVRDGEGAVAADSGSGDVRIVGVQGDVQVDTGSGDVYLERIVAAKIDIDTGSGDIEMVDSSGALNCDTGSGDIVGRGLTLGSPLYADTGSGDVSLSGDFSAVGKITIDTGSGDVTLEASPASATPQVRMAVSTGSGEISLDLPDSRITHTSHGDVQAQIGKATGTAEISTGSGDVVLRARR
ncbi:MAG: DUF4097 family beta strand repeat-containing protein [Thermoanaerobaculia bacterium]